MTIRRVRAADGAPATVVRVAATVLAALLSYAVLVGDTRAAPGSAGPDRGDGARPAAAAAPWAEAYAGLARRADGGCPHAARLALEMVRAGPVVYRMHFPHSAAQLRRWEQLAECRDPPCLGFG